MGERTHYEPGTFSWIDLSTTDVEGAKAFYSRLFGWETEDMPAGDAGTYTMSSLRGRYVCGLSAQREEERSQGVPPHWSSYVTVEDAEAIAERLLAQLPVGASLGVALAADGQESPEALLRDADAAMYAVKRRGGGGFDVVGADRLQSVLA